MTVAIDPYLPPRYIIEDYRRAYRSANGHNPDIHYMGFHWFDVNGETVHRVTVIAEIARLRSLPPRRRSANPADRSIIQRLIDRLKCM
jgi:hypothetical protein